MASSIQIVTPSNLGRVRGVVEVDVAVTGGTTVSAVTVIVGDPCHRLEAGDARLGRHVARAWDTRRSLEDPATAEPG